MFWRTDMNTDKLGTKITCIISLIVFIVLLINTLIVGFRQGFSQAPTLIAIDSMLNGIGPFEIPNVHLAWGFLFVLSLVVFLSTTYAFQKR